MSETPDAAQNDERAFRAQVNAILHAVTPSVEVPLLFTSRSVQRILDEGGPQSWRVNQERGSACPLVQCVYNTHGKYHDPLAQPAAHGAGFLVGLVKELRLTTPPGAQPEYQFVLWAYARVNLAGLWDGKRNSVRYVTLGDLVAHGLDLTTLDWQPMPVAQPSTPPQPQVPAGQWDIDALVAHIAALLAQLKAGMAACVSIQVQQNCITITW